MFNPELLLKEILSGSRTLDLSALRMSVLNNNSENICKNITINGRIRALTALNDFIIVGTEDGGLSMWDSNTLECLKRFSGHTTSITTIAALGSDKLVSGCDDGIIKVWDIHSGECIAFFTENKLKYPNQRYYFRKILALSNNRFASLSCRLIQLWDINKKESEAICVGYNEHHTYDNIFLISEELLIACKNSSGPSFFDTKSGKKMGYFEPGENKDDGSFNLKYYYVGNNFTYFTRLSDGKIAAVLKQHYSSKKPNEISICEIKTRMFTRNKYLERIGAFNAGYINDESKLFSMPDNKLLYSGRISESVVLLDASSKSKLATAYLQKPEIFKRSSHMVQAVLSDGKIIATDIDDKNVFIWQPQFSRALKLSDIQPLLSNIPRNAALESINCQNMDLSDDDIQMLISLLQALFIKEIDLNNTNVTAKGAHELLMALSKHPSLKRVLHRSMPSRQPEIIKPKSNHSAQVAPIHVQSDIEQPNTIQKLITDFGMGIYNNEADTKKETRHSIEQTLNKTETELAELAELKKVLMSDQDKRVLTQLRNRELELTNILNQETFNLAKLEEIELINSCDAMKDYYHFFQVQFSSIFLAAKTIYTGMVENSESSNYGKASAGVDKAIDALDKVGKSIEFISSHMPIINIIGKVLGGALSYADYRAKKEKVNVLATFFTTMEQSEKFGEALARKLTLEQRVKFLLFNKKGKVHSSYFEKLKEKIVQAKNFLLVDDINNDIRVLANGQFEILIKAIVSEKFTQNPSLENLPAFLELLLGKELGCAVSVNNQNNENRMSTGVAISANSASSPPPIKKFYEPAVHSEEPSLRKEKIQVALQPVMEDSEAASKSNNPRFVSLEDFQRLQDELRELRSKVANNAKAQQVSSSPAVGSDMVQLLITDEDIKNREGKVNTLMKLNAGLESRLNPISQDVEALKEDRDHIEERLSRLERGNKNSARTKSPALLQNFNAFKFKSSGKKFSQSQLEAAWKAYSEISSFFGSSKATKDVYKQAKEAQSDELRYEIICIYVNDDSNLHRKFHDILLEKFGLDFFNDENDNHDKADDLPQPASKISQ